MLRRRIVVTADAVRNLKPRLGRNIISVLDDNRYEKIIV